MHMVRILSQTFPLTPEGIAVDGAYVIDAAGLSTDTKPTGATIATGSTFMEVDTGKVYFYNESNQTWVKAGGQ
jgi:hypothetical protein